MSYKGPFGDVNCSNSNVECFDISDGFCQIRCEFTENCMEQFRQKYPSSITIKDIVNMLVCIYKFQIVLETPFQKDRIIDNAFFTKSEKKAQTIFKDADPQHLMEL